MEGWKPQTARSLLVSIEREEGGWWPVFTLPDVWAAQSFEEFILLNRASENQESTDRDALDDADDDGGNDGDGGDGDGGDGHDDGGDGGDGGDDGNNDDDGDGGYLLVKRQWIGHWLRIQGTQFQLWTYI